MPFLKRTENDAAQAAQLEKKASPTPGNGELPAPTQRITFLAIFLGLVASIGGFMFGYVSGQISGFFAMRDYASRFGALQPDGLYTFSPAVQGSIVSFLCLGALFGSLAAGKLADVIGRRLTISTSAFSCCIGTIIEISSSMHWVQFAIGRLITGVGIGALSVTVPMYQSESTPAIIRGVVVACYQLFVTLGIWTAYMIDFGTHNIQSSASWRIPNGISFLWALVLGVGMLFLPESPRYAYRQGRVDEARATIARLGGVDIDDRSVYDQITEIRVKLDEERAGRDTKWWEMFTGPAMLRRVMIGVVLQAGQQLTGANFFFYYGTTIFSQVGLADSYVTQIILGSVNVVCTFGGLYVVQKCSRRWALIIGALWSVVCFLIYSLVGSLALGDGNKAAGTVLIVFSCLFIVAFATTWGPLVWSVVAELFPARYRAPGMALATASNWLFNFLISFFTQFITHDIGYWYGMVFGGSCLFLAGFVFFFVIESKDRSLEEIDTMYVLGVNPITSASWDPVTAAKRASVSSPETSRGGSAWTGEDKDEEGKPIRTLEGVRVTNDDGPPSAQSSPYILPFVQALESKGHTVSVIIPHTQRSWIGKAHIVGQDVQATHYFPPSQTPAAHPDNSNSTPPSGPNDEDTDHPWVLVNSTPACCAQLASEFFASRGKIDLVISGPNYGRNTSALFALSSGTLGAALEATQCSYRSIALSFAFFDRNNDPAIVAEACTQGVRVCEFLAKQGKWETAQLYSVNVPVLKDVTQRPVRWTRILQNSWAKGACFTELPAGSGADDADTEEQSLRRQESGMNGGKGGEETPNGKWKHRHFKWAPRFSDVYESVQKGGPGTDGWVIKEGETSVTALRANFMHAEGPEGELKL